MTVAAAALAVGACGGGAPSGTTTVLPAPDPASVLLHLDDLPTAGFAGTTPAGSASVDDVALGDTGLSQLLRQSGFRDAAGERFFRAVASLATSNGPVDIVERVARFGSAAAAGTGLGLLERALDHLAGSTPLSAGPLGDGGHAVLRTADDGGTTVAETTLVWRTGALVSTLVVRERLAGSPLAHALLVARPALIREGGATPDPATG